MPCVVSLNSYLTLGSEWHAKNVVLKVRIHKIGTVLKLQDVCIFGSNMPFSFHLRAAMELLSRYSVSRQPVNEKGWFTTQALQVWSLVFVDKCKVHII